MPVRGAVVPVEVLRVGHPRIVVGSHEGGQPAVRAAEDDRVRQDFGQLPVLQPFGILSVGRVSRSCCSAIRPASSRVPAGVRFGIDVATKARKSATAISANPVRPKVVKAIRMPVITMATIRVTQAPVAHALRVLSGRRSYQPFSTIWS